MPVKVLNDEGVGTGYQCKLGIEYAVDHGAKVINLSFGDNFPDVYIKNAVKYAYQHGCVVICSAGNEALEGNPTIYPAAYDSYCISVAATTHNKVRASYSCYNSHVDIAAPGGDFSDGSPSVNDQGIAQQTFNSTGNYTQFGVMLYSGTSMAAPHVTGVAAMLMTAGFTDADMVREILQSTAIDLGTPGRDDEFGYGLLNAYAALTYFSFGDINLDSKVDLADLSIFSQYWMLDIFPVRVDITHDGVIDEMDLLRFSQDWLD